MCLYFASSNQAISPTGRVLMLEHLGQGCGAMNAVAAHSKAGALNLLPQLRQMNVFSPKYIVLCF